MGYELLDVKNGDKVVIRPPHGKGGGGSRNLPSIELEILHVRPAGNCQRVEYDGKTMICDPQVELGGSGSPSVSWKTLISDLHWEDLLSGVISNEIYDIFNYLRRIKAIKKGAFWQQDQSEKELRAKFKHLNKVMAEKYTKIYSKWVFEVKDEEEKLKSGAMRILNQDLTSFFRFLMRILQLYQLGPERVRIIQWAGWKTGIPVFVGDAMEKVLKDMEGVPKGRGGASGKGNEADANKASDKKDLPLIIYTRKNLKYLDKYPKEVLDRFGIIPLASSVRQDRHYWAVLDPFDQGWRFFMDALRQPNEPEYLHVVDIADYDQFRGEMGKRLDYRQTSGDGASVEDGSQELPYEAIPDRMLKMLQDAQDQRASDIHIEADDEKGVVRFRVDGVLSEYAEFAKETHNAIVSHFKVKTQMDVTEKRRPQDGRLTVHGTDIRASTYPTVKGEKFVLRLLDQEGIKKSTDYLGMLSMDLQLLRTNIHNPSGLILICGPTGSGKTTTLYACLSELNTRESNIMTIEEPVEYQLHGINQMQVRTDIDLTFEKGLRTILRQDPDIIMVGEIRDSNTANTAIQAAMTGHLVLSTIHTNSAPQAIGRLLEMGVEPYMITSALNLTVSQRLVRRVCLSCRKPISGAEIRRKMDDNGFDYGHFVQTFGMDIPLQDYFYEADPHGCEQCFNRGYQGRMAIFETFNMNREVRDCIHAKKTDTEELWEALRGPRWKEMTLWAHARSLLMRQGVTTFDEITRVMGY
ncbi:MAG: type II/IV secretion system protein [Nitrospirae bacterium]|nr:type II/IV secretion system protein [Magnetococcales bacterium]